MSDKIIHPHSAHGATLYAVFINDSGQFWNGSAFESFVGANWSTYAVALSEWTTTKIYRATIPAFAAGHYAWVVKTQAGASPDTTDTIVGSGSFDWDGSAIADLALILSHGDSAWATLTSDAVAAAVLATPANKLDTNSSGQVAVSATNQTAIAAAVWAAGTRTLSGFGTLVADIVSAVTPYITGWPSASTIADAVWTRSSRLLSGFGFTVTATNVNAIKAVTDKLDTALEQDGGVYRFSANALEQGPDSGDATSAGQDAILTAISDLAAIDENVIAEAIMDATVDGALNVRAALKRIAAVTAGRCVVTDTDPLVLAFYNAAGDTVVATLTVPLNSSGREVA